MARGARRSRADRAVRAGLRKKRAAEVRDCAFTRLEDLTRAAASEKVVQTLKQEWHTRHFLLRVQHTNLQKTACTPLEGLQPQSTVRRWMEDDGPRPLLCCTLDKGVQTCSSTSGRTERIIHAREIKGCGQTEAKGPQGNMRKNDDALQITTTGFVALAAYDRNPLIHQLQHKAE